MLPPQFEHLKQRKNGNYEQHDFKKQEKVHNYKPPI